MFAPYSQCSSLALLFLDHQMIISCIYIQYCLYYIPWYRTRHPLPLTGARFRNKVPKRHAASNTFQPTTRMTLLTARVSGAQTALPFLFTNPPVRHRMKHKDTIAITGNSKIAPIHHTAIISKSSLPAPQSGQRQVSGTSSHRVPGIIPLSGNPIASS